MRWLQYISQNVFPVFPALGIRTAGMFPKPQHCRYEPFWPCHFKIWSFAMNCLVWGKKKCISYSQYSQVLLVIWCRAVRREEGPRPCHPSAVVGQHRVTWVKESSLDLDFGPILAIVLDMGIFQIPVGNPTSSITVPVSWEAAGADATAVPSWERLPCPTPGAHWPQEELTGCSKCTLQAISPWKNIAHIARV